MITSDSSMLLPCAKDHADDDWAWNWSRATIVDRADKDQTGGAFGIHDFRSKRASRVVTRRDPSEVAKNKLP